MVKTKCVCEQLQPKRDAVFFVVFDKFIFNQFFKAKKKRNGSGIGWPSPVFIFFFIYIINKRWRMQTWSWTILCDFKITSRSRYPARVKKNKFCFFVNVIYIYISWTNKKIASKFFLYFLKLAHLKIHFFCAQSKPLVSLTART